MVRNGLLCWKASFWFQHRLLVGGSNSVPCSVQKIKTHKRFKINAFVKTRHNTVQIFNTSALYERQDRTDGLYVERGGGVGEQEELTYKFFGRLVSPRQETSARTRLFHSQISTWVFPYTIPTRSSIIHSQPEMHIGSSIFPLEVQTSTRHALQKHTNRLRQNDSSSLRKVRLLVNDFVLNEKYASKSISYWSDGRGTWC